MYQIYFLLVLYVGFIVYGISDCSLGCVWPEFSKMIGISLASLGILNCISYAASGIASATAYRIRKKIGNNYSIVLGLAIIVLAYITYLNAHNVYILTIGVVFIGFGGGIVNAISNSYVVKYHEPGKVAYLHAFWGIGSTIAPIIMGFSLSTTNAFSRGLSTILGIVICMILLLLGVKRFWENKKKTLSEEEVLKYTISDEEKQDTKNLLDVFKVKYGIWVLLCFFFSNCLNGATSAWLATIVVGQKGFTAIEGATASSCFFFALTVSRILFGFVSKKLKTNSIIAFGYIVCLIGLIMLSSPINTVHIVYLFVIVIGIGIGPIIPFLSALTKDIFGEKDLALIISAEGVANLLGCAASSAVAGLFVNIIGVNSLPFLIIGFLIVSFVLFFVIKDKKVSV